jgi:hypothetical protein
MFCAADVHGFQLLSFHQFFFHPISYQWQNECILVHVFCRTAQASWIMTTLWACSRGHQPSWSTGITWRKQLPKWGLVHSPVSSSFGFDLALGLILLWVWSCFGFDLALGLILLWVWSCFGFDLALGLILLWVFVLAASGIVMSEQVTRCSQVADACDMLMVLVDPKMLRFNPRELHVYAHLHKRFKVRSGLGLHVIFPLVYTHVRCAECEQRPEFLSQMDMQGIWHMKS